MPYGYFQFVRFVSFIGFIYLGIQSKNSTDKMEQNKLLYYFALALFFQPFFKISLGREIWNIVDVVIGIGLLLSIFVKPKGKN